MNQRRTRRTTPRGRRASPASRSRSASRIRTRPTGERTSSSASEPSPSPRGERLQKVLARAGLGSRRFCEQLITAGRVTVNGKQITELGSRVDPFRDSVAFDGEKLRAEKPSYLLVYKPKGYLCTHQDPDGRPTVYDLLPRQEQRRLFSIGRLDRASEGLLILTNDGTFADLLAHPRHELPKTYVVTLKGCIPTETVVKLRQGVWLSDGKTHPARVRILERRSRQSKLEVTLSEGRNRQIRRMLARFDFKVPELTRTRIGPLGIGRLRPGSMRRLLREEVDMLRREASEVSGGHKCQDA